MNHPLKVDLDHILNYTEPFWRALDGARLFFTGGTGLFGVWFLESILWAQKELDVKFDVTLLSRNSDAFLQKYPQFQNKMSLRFHRGDITDFTPPAEDFSHIIHGATTSALATFKNEDPLKKFDNVAEGTRRTLEFAAVRKVQHFWFLGSGSAYGKQPYDMPLMLEEYQGAPDTMETHGALGQGKRAAEFLCAVYAEKYSMNVKIARCFSFLGPHLPLDIHYAIGNFIGDGLAGRPILIRGDGTPIRSYLYMADLVIWLMTIFTNGKSQRIYNVGSEEGLSIVRLAHLVAGCFTPTVKVQLATTPTPAPLAAASNLYVPSTRRAAFELGLKQLVSTEEGIRRTIQFYKAAK